MATIQLKTVKVTTDLEKFVAEVLPADIQSTIHYIFLSELEAQAKLHNVATRLTFDGKKGGSLPNAKFRAQAFFATKERLLQAAQEAYTMLLAQTRIKSGRARASYWIYVNESPIASPDNLKTIVDVMDASDQISIVGPGVPYGRRLYWNPAGKPRRIRKKKGHVSLKNGEKVTVYGVYNEPMHKAVVRMLTRKYPEIAIFAYFLPLKHGSGMQGERFPALGLWLKAGGKPAN